MKILSVLALAAVTGASALASKLPTTIGCAVMPDHKVNIAAATKSKLFADFKGNRYYFCCNDCPNMFKKNPAKYAKAPHTKIPKS